MEPLRTLVAAGLRRDKGTFIGLAVLVFLAAFAQTFTISLFSDLSERADVRYGESGAGDMYVIDWGMQADADVVERLEALPEVGSVRETRAFSVPVQFEDATGAPMGDLETATSIFEAYGSGMDVALLDEGFGSYADRFAPPAPGEVYIAPAASVLYGADLGDVLALRFEGEERRLTVAGFFEDPQLGTPFMEVKRYLVAPETFDELYPLAEADYEQALSSGSVDFGIARMPYPLTEFNLTLAPEARADSLNGQDLAGIIHEEVDWGTSETSGFAKETLVGYALMVVQIVTALLAVFALLLFAVALVLCVHAVSTAIEEGYADQGIAKAVGVSPALLRRSLVAQYGLVAFMALVLGFAAGIAVEPLAWPPFLLITGVLVQGASLSVWALACSGALLVVLVGAVAFKARKLGHITPLAALRQGTGDVRFSPRGTCRIDGGHLEASLAWRALVSQKRRYVGVSASALLLCAFISLCFGIGGAVAEDDAVYRSFGIWKSDVSAELVSDDVTLDEVREAIEEVAPIAREWQEEAVALNPRGERRVFVGLSDLGVLDESCLMSGRMPRLENEAAIGLNFARGLDLAVGDEFAVEDARGTERTLIVSGILATVLNGGDGAVVTIDGAQRLGGEGAASGKQARQYQLAEGADADAVLAHVKERFGDAVSFDATGLFGTAANTILLIRNVLVMAGYLMTAFALLIGCVAVALVSRRMLAGERHDLGIYRALGFRARTLRLSFSLRFLGVALVGGALGIALVYAGGSALVGNLFGLFGAGAFTIALPVWQAAFIGTGLAAVFALSAYAFSRSICDISVRELVIE